MSFETVVFLVGAGLIVLGVTGGKLRIKDWGEADAVGAFSRIALGVFGCILVLAAFGQMDRVLRVITHFATSKRDLGNPPPDIATTAATASVSPGSTSSDAPIAAASATLPPRPEKKSELVPSRSAPNDIKDASEDIQADSEMVFTAGAPRLVYIHCDPLKVGSIIELSKTVKIMINDQEKATCRTATGSTGRIIKLTVKGGDRYSLKGEGSWKDENEFTRDIRGHGVFADDPRRLDYNLYPTQIDKDDIMQFQLQARN